MAVEDVEKLVAAYQLVGEQTRAKITGISRTGWRNLESRGRETGQNIVPSRVVLSQGKSGWRLADLIEWAKSRPVYKPAPAPRCGKKRAAPQRGGE